LSLEERVGNVQKELEALEARLKEQADFKSQLKEAQAEKAELLQEVHQLEGELEGFKGLTTNLKEKEAEIERLGKVVAHHSQEMQESEKRHEAEKTAEKTVLLERLAQANASMLGFKRLLKPIVTELIEEQFQDVVKRATETVRETTVKEQVQAQPYTATKTLGDFTVEVARQPLALDAKSTRGRILYLITDGFFTKPTSVPKIIKELRDQFIEVRREEIEPELAFFVQEEVLHHVVLATGAHVYQLRADAKDRVRKVVKEA